MRRNGVEHLIVLSEGDAMTLMHLSTSYEKRFDVIDLDPYGCPNRFLDGAIQSLTSGGSLLVTANDMAVLAGKTPEACNAKYSSVPLRMKCCHEMGLRILLHCIETHSNRLVTKVHHANANVTMNITAAESHNDRKMTWSVFAGICIRLLLHLHV
ncbi:tRNA (guanine(26)-N(2))-dimethyltransferase-like [Eurosta solidaginis]|uniref:tRNA (guanine(26)-N(2))-dimethyltransferase-like n=1 Tax=Eurosta solidaginis TaxID=178769 RepID=UPI0035305C4E